MTHSIPRTPHLLSAQTRAIMIVTGVILASVMDAIASTGLSIGRIGLLGATSTTPDEFALFDVAFVAAKLTSFLVTPLFVRAWGPIACLRVGTVALLLSSVVMTLFTDTVAIIVCRTAQGLAGGSVLIAGQALLFFRFFRRHQPIVQALFAFGAVMAPTTLTPAFQGLLIDRLSWDWIFLSNLPLGVVALVLLGADGSRKLSGPARFPPFQVLCLAIAMGSVSYVLQQGSRLNWLDDVSIIWFMAVGTIGVTLFAALERTASRRGLSIAAPLGDPNLRFGLLASLVAGFALSGSAFLVPAFALNVLGFTAEDAGLLLLPSGATLAAALLFAGCLISKIRTNPIALVPLGILFFAAAMWLLSGSTSGSGHPDLIMPLLLRGFGLGLLFVALTLVALTGLSADTLPFGIGLFNFGKQVGGLIGIATLQTYIDHQTALNRAVLASHLTAGNASLELRLKELMSSLVARGLEPGAATKAALPILQRSVEREVATISFNEAFLAFVLLFVVAAPCLIIAKKALGRGVS